MVRKVIGMMLESFGWNFTLSKNGDEALELYKKSTESGNPFDAVILDLTIVGGMGGEETIKRLLEIDPNVKAIISSGYSGDSAITDYKKLGFKGAIAKPYKMKELRNLLRTVIIDS